MYISCGCMEVGALKEVWYSNLPDIKGTAAKNTKLYTASSLGLQLNAHIKTRHSCPGLKESTICDLFLFSPKVLHINTVALNTGPIYTAIQKSSQCTNIKYSSPLLLDILQVSSVHGVFFTMAAAILCSIVTTLYVYTYSEPYVALSVFCLSVM